MDLPGKVWTYEAVHDLALRMQRRATYGFRVGPSAGRLVVDALFSYAAEHFRADRHGFQIDVWTPDDTRIQQRYAETEDLALAHQAFERAAAAYPSNPVTLRKGGHLIRQYIHGRRSVSRG